jgi:hypothetical protein
MIEMTDGSVVSVRRAVLLALAAGLSLAALIAIVAIITGSFDQTDVRLVVTSLGFSVFSALGAAGASARRRGRAPMALSSATVTGAAVGFALLLILLWINHDASSWRAFGAVALATLAGSHACLVISAGRASDSQLISGLAVASIATAAIDSTIGVLAIVGPIKHVDRDAARVLGVLVIVMLLTTALPPILRRLASNPKRDVTQQPTMPGVRDGRAETRLLEIAARLEQLAPAAGETAEEIRTDAAELRCIARSLTP